MNKAVANPVEPPQTVAPRHICCDGYLLRYVSKEWDEPIRKTRVTYSVTREEDIERGLSKLFAFHVERPQLEPTRATVIFELKKWLGLIIVPTINKVSNMSVSRCDAARYPLSK